MKIGELKKWPRLHKRATTCHKKYRAHYGEDFGKCVDDEHLGCAFCWKDTLEGYIFWAYINREDIQSAKELHPELFIDTRGHRHLENEEVKQYLIDKGFPVECDVKITDLPTVDGENTDMYGNPVEYIQIPIMDKVLDTLNELGEEGWKLVVKEGPVYTFLRNKRGGAS